MSESRLDCAFNEKNVRDSCRTRIKILLKLVVILIGGYLSEEEAFIDSPGVRDYGQGLWMKSMKSYRNSPTTNSSGSVT